MSDDTNNSETPPAPTLESVTAERDALQEQLDAAINERDALQKQLDAAVSERDALAEALVNLKAKPKAVTAKDAAKKPRKIGAPTEDDEIEDRAARTAELKAMIANAGTVEIAFSDGEREIAGTRPIVPEGDAWREHQLGLMLDVPVEIVGPQEGMPSFAIAGYGLIIDGKQVAYCRRMDVVQVGAGQRQRFVDDIVF